MAVEVKTREAAVKQVARKLAELSDEMVLAAFDPHWSYYTGVSRLFRKPDFNELRQRYPEFNAKINEIVEKRAAAEAAPRNK